MRIGLYGGSFDPVHNAHLLVAQAAREEAGLDKIFFIPAAQSPFKPDQKLSAGTARAAMLRLALADQPWAAVDTQEIDRGGTSFTIDTVRSYQGIFPGAELFYLIGADHVSQLPRWREAAVLAAAITFLVIPRPGEPELAFPGNFQGRYLRGFPLALSASMIRDRVGRGFPVDFLAPSAVAEYLRNNGLYL